MIIPRNWFNSSLFTNSCQNITFSHTWFLNYVINEKIFPQISTKQNFLAADFFFIIYLCISICDGLCKRDYFAEDSRISHCFRGRFCRNMKFSRNWNFKMRVLFAILYTNTCIFFRTQQNYSFCTIIIAKIKEFIAFDFWIPRQML